MDVVGIDVGGTRVKAVRVGADGAVEAEESVATPGDTTALDAAVIALAGSLRTSGTAAIGVACPGIVADGVVRFAANLPWRDEPVRAVVESAVGLPVVVAHDVGSAALAESAAVAGDDVLFVALGTGIACAHVVGGVLRGGATGQAGEIGHSPVRPGGEACACGQRGCLEAYASASAVSRRYAARTGIARDTAALSGRLGTDPDAAAVWDDAVAALADALATSTVVTDPGTIVLGGGLAGAGEALLGPVRAALAGRLSWRAAPPLRAAVLGEAAGRLGVAALARRSAASRAPRRPVDELSAS